MSGTVSLYDFRLRACLVAGLKKGPPDAADPGHLFLKRRGGEGRRGGGGLGRGGGVACLK